MTRTTADVACTVCGCVCDDLRVRVDGDRITPLSGACWLAKPWFAGLNTAPPHGATIDGTAASFEDAVARAAAILSASKYPLVYGLSRSTTEGQRAAVALADRLGATIDTTASTGHAPSIMALQQVGESTCTLGEVKQRADLVMFWGSDPLTTHPRHIERYCPPRPGRTLVVVDAERSETAQRADLFIQVDRERQWEALWQLRMRVKGVAREATTELSNLADLMTACKFGIVFFGAGVTGGPLAHRTVEALLQLVTDLNDGRRFYARRMRRYGDVAGADSVLTWQTGYPFGVNFAAGYPRYNPGEFTGPDLLARKEVDACVLVGSETAKDFPPVALDHLRTIPVIALDPPGVRPLVDPAVSFTTAVYGVHRPGTAYRLDEVPIPLRVLTPSGLPSDGDVLSAVLNRIDNFAARSAPIETRSEQD